jgi:magnesium transporter
MSPSNNPDRPLAALLMPDLLELLEEAPQSVSAQTEELHPADLADIAELMPVDRAGALLAALPRERAADVLEYLEEEFRTEVLETLSARDAASMLEEMTPDERADVLEELDDETADEILSELTPEAAAETERLRQYDPHTAGGLMTTEFVSVAEALTVEQALRSVRAMARAGRKEAMYTVVSVGPDTPQEEVSNITSNYDLVALPVVDNEQRVLGVVTVDDVIDVIQEEQTEDAQKVGGMEALDEPYMTIGLVDMLRKRGGWLAVLFVGELFTASAIHHYEGSLDKLLILSTFIPLIIASGGNSGSQATSLIIRAMALGEVRLADWWRVAKRELPTGFALGLLLGALGFARILAWQYMATGRWHLGSLSLGHDYEGLAVPIALTVSVALIGVVTFGSLVGSMLPFILRRLGADPASASAPFVATLVDVSGIVIYFTAASIFLGSMLN